MLKADKENNYCTKINNTILNVNQVNKIPLNNVTLDTLYFTYCFDRITPVHWADHVVFKMLNNNHYTLLIKGQQISMLPKSRNTNGLVRFCSINNKDTLLIKSFRNTKSDTIFNSNKPTTYFKAKKSYHPIDVQVFEYSSSNRNHRRQNLSHISFFFLHKEKFTITYNQLTRKLEINLEGYIE
jgi:hypothetical protein